MRINNTIINTKNISYITHERYDTSGYIHKENWVIYIHFIGSKESLSFEFFDYQEFKNVLNKLEVAFVDYEFICKTTWKENKDE